MSACQVCTAPTDVFLCTLCTSKLRKNLAEMPALVVELEVTATRQDRMGVGGKRAKGDEAPLPFNWSAADQLWALWNTVGTWARHLAESRQVAAPVQAVVLVWLLGALDSIRMDEAAGQIFDEIGYVHAQAERLIDRPDPDIYAGRCDAADVRVTAEGGTIRTSVGTCGADLYARLDDAAVKCQTCGMEYDLGERKRDLLGRIPDVLATSVAIANALTTLLSPVTPSMIRQMSFRKQIANRGTAEVPMYRVGDVMSVLAERAQRLSERQGRRVS